MASYWPRKTGKKAAKTREKEEVRESISKQFPEAFVRAVRDTPFQLDDSHFGTPEHGYASTGVGLKELAKLQLQAMNASDLEELEFFSIAGKEALQEIQKAQSERAKQKTMDELKDIMNRINFTLTDLKTTEKVLSVTPQEDLARIERIEDERRRRKQKKKRRRSLMKKRMTRKAERKAREIEEKDESSDEGTKETGRLSKTKGREGKITPGGKKKVKESEKMEEIKRMEGEIAEVDKEGRRTKMEIISEEQGIMHEKADGELRKPTERIAGKKGLESEIAEMETTVHEDAEELKRQIAEGVKEIQRMAGVEAQVIEKQMAMIDEDLVQLSDISTSSEDNFSLSSEDLEAFDSWSSMSDFSFASSEVYSDQEEVDYDQLKKDLTAPLALSPSMAEKAEQRRETSDTIASFVERCLEREEQLVQLQSWMEAITAEELPASFQDQEAAICAYSPDLLEEAKSLQVQSVLEEFKNSMKKLKDIADSLGIGEKAEEEVVQETPEKKQYVQRLPIPTKTKVQQVFNEEELSIPDNFSKAATTLSNTLEEAMKSCPSRRVRVGISEGLKQFQFIVKVLESREEKLHNMDKEILNMGTDQVKSKRQVEDLRKAKKKMLVKCEKLENIVDDQKTKLTMTEKKIEELNRVVQEYKRRDSLGLYDESEEESDVSSSTSSPSFGDLPTGKRKEEKEKKKKRKKAEKAAQKRKQKGKAGKKKSEKSEKRGSQKTDEEEEDAETQLGVRRDELKSQQVIVKPIDVENTEIYQNLNSKFEEACNELQVEHDKLAQSEKQLEKVRKEKIKYVQEKIDHKIEMEQLIRKQEVETEELRDSIANYEMETKKLKSEVDSNEEMIQYQEERITQYAEELQHLEERMMGSLPETPAMSSTSFAQTGGRRGRKTSVEPPTARQMVTKIKQQYESEIQGLKDFLSKENHRFQADSRRKDQEHKKDIQNIHKESLQVLRCINRFKEGAANLLDRENLSGEAHAMRKLPNLTLDESPAEIRQMLAKMAILSNELLISMELQLSKALMNKRLEVKDTSNARTIYQKELENQTTALRKAKDVGALQANKLKVARDEMMEYEAQAFRFKLQEGEKKEVLEERYKELYSEYIALRREGIAARKVERSEREKDEEINRKEAIIMKTMRKEKALQRALDEQRKIIANLTSAWQLRRFGQYYITKNEQIQNLETLKEALHDDRIRRGPYEMTTNLIKDAIELPKRRFIELVQKYYRHIKMKEMEERVKRARFEDNLGDKFVYMLERRIQKQRDVWSKKREEFVKKRADILMQLSKVLTRISQEAEVLLAQPKVLTVRAGQTREIPTGIPDLFEAVKILKERERAREMIPMRVPSIIPGDISPPMGIKIEYSGVDQEWKLKGRPPPSQVVIATPRILDLDVNMTRIAAQEILSHVSKMPWNQASQSLPALKTFTSRKFPSIQKSLSQPAPRRGNLFGGEKRALALPPIATFYSSDDIHQHKETKINQ